MGPLMAAPTVSLESLLTVLRHQRVVTAKDLGRRLDISQPTVSRLVAQAGSAVVKIGRARATRYSATRDVRGLGRHWPLFRINAQGRPEDVGRLVALHGDGCLLEADNPPAWLRGEFADGLFPGIPWFLDDQRPQGFLGRKFAQRHARELGLRDDILQWNADDVLTALLLRGDDGPGQFVLGKASLERALQTRHAAIPADDRQERYASMAADTIAGLNVGSSAAGEQPKFVTCVDDGNGALRHVIVKFTEPVDQHPTARRWADLLIAEHLAGVILAEHGTPSARSELIWSGGRLCLESTRFDRQGAFGRRGMVSLAAWSDAYDGLRGPWYEVAERMRAGGWLNAMAQQDIEQRWWFAKLIANNDTHYGNLSFFLDDALPMEPCPNYDMLPMDYRPGAGGNLPDAVYEPPAYPPASMASWQRAAGWAEQFWDRLAGNDDVSQGFRALARANGDALQAIRQRLG
jgi:hypothetical protein